MDDAVLIQAQCVFKAFFELPVVHVVGKEFQQVFCKMFVLHVLVCLELEGLHLFHMF